MGLYVSSYSTTFAPVVIRLVRQPPLLVLLLYLPQVLPGLKVVQPGVQQGLVHREALAGLDLERTRG